MIVVRISSNEVSHHGKGRPKECADLINSNLLHNSNIVNSNLGVHNIKKDPIDNLQEPL